MRITYGWPQYYEIDGENCWAITYYADGTVSKNLVNTTCV